jgi:hypothetical protein
MGTNRGTKIDERRRKRGVFRRFGATRRGRRSGNIAFFSGRGKTKNFFRTFLPRRREKKEEKNGEK